MSTDIDNSDEFDKLLDDFISKQLSDMEDTINEQTEIKKDNKPQTIVQMPEDEGSEQLYPEEKQLYDAYS